MTDNSSSPVSSPQTHAPATAIPSDVEDLLAFRVARKALKLVSAIIVPFLAVLGFFGYDAVARVNEAASRLEHVRDSLVASAAETQRHISEAEHEVDELRQLRADYRDVFSKEAVDAGVRRSLMDSSLQESHVALRAVASALDSLRGTRENVTAALRYVDAERDSLNAVVRTYGRTVDDIRRRVFNSWTFVLKEKERDPISLQGTGVAVRFTTIRNQRVRDLDVFEDGGSYRRTDQQDTEPSSSFKRGSTPCVTN